MDSKSTTNLIEKGLAVERIVLHSPDDTIELRQIIPEDAVAYFEFVDGDRPHFSQHGDITSDKYSTLESVQERIANTRPDEYRFGVWDEGEMVGFMKVIKNDDGELETGSLVASRHAGKRYAYRARQIALQFAFDKLGAEKVVSEITVGNEPSRKSVERSGYVLTGEHDGSWRYEITGEKYNAMKATNNAH